MTREEIRKGIEVEFLKYMMRQGAMIKMPKELSLNIIKRLHSQGVVIRVDRELPLKEITQALEVDIEDRRGLKSEWQMIDSDVKRELKATWGSIIKRNLAGHVATIPLIGGQDES